MEKRMRNTIDSEVPIIRWNRFRYPTSDKLSVFILYVYSPEAYRVMGHEHTFITQVLKPIIKIKKSI